MSSNPIKLLAFTGAAALLAGGFLGQSFDGRPADDIGRAGPPIIAPEQTRAAAPTQSQAFGFGNVVLRSDRGGHFRALVEIDGLTIPMMVDTGATVVALRHEDAAMLGINPAPSDFVVKIATANGDIHAANVRLREMRLENIVAPDVRAVVMPPGKLGQSLLGMSFMNKLKGFEIAGGQLVLKP